MVRAEVSVRGRSGEGLSLWGHVSADPSQDGLPILATMETPAGYANCTEKGSETESGRIKVTEE